MASSAPPLLLVLLLTWSPPAFLVESASSSYHGLKHIHMYMHETFAGPSATLVVAVPSPLGANASFGRVGVVDDELRDGPDPKSSSLVGRYQGIFAGARLVSPPGMQSAINFVFTDGEHSGSTLAMLGPILSFTGAIERAVVGGTGAFRMARGYCVMTAVRNPTPDSIVYEVDLFVKMNHA